MAPHEIGAVLLSTSFLAALIVGGIAGWLGGRLIGAGAGALAISVMSLAAAWIAWQGGDQPDRGVVRVPGIVAPDPAQGGGWRPAGESSVNEDLIIRYTDQSGKQRDIPGSYSSHPLAPGQAVNLDYPADKPDHATVVDSGRHRTLLIVFLLFGAVPLAMSLVLFATVWENRPGKQWTPPPRTPAVLETCSWARVAANLIFVSGFVVTFWYTDIRSVAFGFPLVGAGALAHAVIGAISGMKPSQFLIAVVVGVGFVGFGFFGQSVL